MTRNASQTAEDMTVWDEDRVPPFLDQMRKEYGLVLGLLVRNSAVEIHLVPRDLVCSWIQADSSYDILDVVPRRAQKRKAPYLEVRWQRATVGARIRLGLVLGERTHKSVRRIHQIVVAASGQTIKNTQQIDRGQWLEVHHRNHHIFDNRLENLTVIRAREHQLLHMQDGRQGVHHRWESDLDPDLLASFQDYPLALVIRYLEPFWQSGGCESGSSGFEGASGRLPDDGQPSAGLIPETGTDSSEVGKSDNHNLSSGIEVGLAQVSDQLRVLGDSCSDTQIDGDYLTLGLARQGSESLDFSGSSQPWKSEFGSELKSPETHDSRDLGEDLESHDQQEAVEGLSRSTEGRWTVEQSGVFKTEETNSDLEDSQPRDHLWKETGSPDGIQQQEVEFQTREEEDSSRRGDHGHLDSRLSSGVSETASEPMDPRQLVEFSAERFKAMGFKIDHARNLAMVAEALLRLGASSPDTITLSAWNAPRRSYSAVRAALRDLVSVGVVRRIRYGVYEIVPGPMA